MIRPPTELRTVLLDLDGTLADTAPDLAYALNTLRREQGYAELPFEAIRPVVSHGATALVRLGFGAMLADDVLAVRRRRLLELYRQYLACETRLFSGMELVLDYIESAGMNWGVVTNKPASFTEPLMQALGLTLRAACIVSGDTTVHRKPHPEPLLLACRLAQSEISQCIYVGDAERDVRAGQAAGMTTLVALFGYLAVDDHPETWGADALVKDPRVLLSWIVEHTPRAYLRP